MTPEGCGSEELVTKWEGVFSREGVIKKKGKTSTRKGSDLKEGGEGPIRKVCLDKVQAAASCSLADVSFCFCFLVCGGGGWGWCFDECAGPQLFKTGSM